MARIILASTSPTRIGILRNAGVPSRRCRRGSTSGWSRRRWPHPARQPARSRWRWPRPRRWVSARPTARPMSSAPTRRSRPGASAGTSRQRWGRRATSSSRSPARSHQLHSAVVGVHDGTVELAPSRQRGHDHASPVPGRDRRLSRPRRRDGARRASAPIRSKAPASSFSTGSRATISPSSGCRSCRSSNGCARRARWDDTRTRLAA